MTAPIAPQQHADAPDDVLRYEHLVEVDGAQEHIPQVGVEPLWRGLLLRVQFPQNFQPGLESCEVLALDDGELLRTLQFGSREVRDRVRIDAAARRIHSEVLGLPSDQQAQLSMQVEHPPGGGLWVRFMYAVRSPDHRADAPLASFVKDAWRQADEETVFRIRQLALSGVLDGQGN